MVKALLVAVVKPVGSGGRGCSCPVLPVILQPAKEATPPVALSGLVVQARVPARVGADGQGDRVGGRGHRVAAGCPRRVTAGWVAQTAPLAPPPGWVVKASWEAAPSGDVEGVAGRRGEPGRGGGQGVAAGLAGDLAAGEGGHAARRASSGLAGAGQGAPARVGADGEGDRSCWRRSPCCRLVLDAHDRLGRPGRPVGSAAGLGREDQLGGRAGRDVEAGARCRRASPVAAAVKV